MNDPAITRRPSSRVGARARLRQMGRRPGRAAGVARWQALERVQFLALVAAPAPGISKEGAKSGTRKGRSIVSGWHGLGVGALVAALSIGAVDGGAAPRYRDFQLGGNLQSISALAGVPATDAKTIHERPALLQELEWRRGYTAGNETAVNSVRQIAFSFYDDQLFRMVIDYDRERTDGMTDADMVEAISTMYGTPVKPASKANRAALARVDQESGVRVAQWGDGEYAAVLYRSSYASGFRMVVTSPRLSALARTAEAQAVRLEESDAPRRERVRQQNEADADRAAQVKARSTNKAGFKP
jgi:hypothetical protein